MIDEILEDKIYNYTEELATVENPQLGDTKTLVINDTYSIKAVYTETEEHEFVYEMILLSADADEMVDSIYCNKTPEELEDIVYFFIEEYNI